ncbi:MAG TPA: hypothetical protein VN829_04120 [Dongiaceae bacterium]|nr:hypothetical protein [Dongiaceae bacterium]
MKKVRFALTLGLALSAISALADLRHDPFARFSAGVNGSVTLPVATPIGNPATLLFVESGWTGTATVSGLEGETTYTVTVSDVGYLTIANPTKPVWNVSPHCVAMTFTFYDDTDTEVGSMYGTFHTTGTLNTATGVVDTSGYYDFTSGTGIFDGVKGFGTVGASGTAAAAFCPFEGWLEY